MMTYPVASQLHPAGCRAVGSSPKCRHAPRVTMTSAVTGPSRVDSNPHSMRGAVSRRARRVRRRDDVGNKDTVTTAIAVPQSRGDFMQVVMADSSAHPPSVVQERRASEKPRIVILGSGWGAMSTIKGLKNNIAAERYEITVISPRNHFVYTPLLPSVASGTCEERSIVEPVRKLVAGKAKFLEAECEDIDLANKTIMAKFPNGSDGERFELPYDLLVVTVGSVTNTFNTPGVEEHCLFMKSIQDARKLRKQITERFELAALPLPDEERAKLLSFVIVGGGPTGVEVAAEMHDLLEDNLKRLYPELMPFCTIRLVASDDHMLSTYDRAISDFTLQQFDKMGIQTYLHCRATAVTENSVQMCNKHTGEASEVPYGICVWATGIKINPLVEKLKAKLPSHAQTHSRCLVTDTHMRVKGSDGSIYCLGDAGTIGQEEANAHAAELFLEGDTNGDGKLQLSELRALLLRASETYPHLQDYADFLDGKAGSLRLRSLAAQALSKDGSKTAKELLGELDMNSELSLEEFQQLLAKIDANVRALPATAQVAGQQGAYFAKLLSKTTLSSDTDLATLPKFEYVHKGSLAYVGNDKAVMDAPFFGGLFGVGIGAVWKSFETASQFSVRTRVLVAADWFRAKVLGRDTSLL